jgi:N-methylhydantoinase A
MARSSSRILVGADTGGTFTDLVLVHRDGIRIWKVPSTPDDFSRGVLQGLGHLLASDERETPVPREGVELVHASTVATNALLERTGARMAARPTIGEGALINTFDMGRTQ